MDVSSSGLVSNKYIQNPNIYILYTYITNNNYCSYSL